MTLSSYSTQRFTDWLVGNASMPAAGTRFLALFNGDPEGAGTEVTTTIRPAGRVAITSDMSAADSNGESTNSSEIDFGSADAGATVTHLAIYDAVSSGNRLVSSARTGGSIVIETDQNVTIPISDLLVNTD